MSFIEQIRCSVSLASQLLGSKATSDVHEALEFLATAQEFELPGAKEGVRKSLLLMSSSEQAIRDLVMEIYTRLYFSPVEGSSDPHSVIVVRNLLSLVGGANIGELASLEEMLHSLMKANKLTDSVVQMLWSVFSGNAAWARPYDVEYSLMTLSMMTKVDKTIVQHNLPLLLQHGFNADNLVVARYSCQALLCLADRVSQTRFPSDHPLFAKLTKIIVASVTSNRTTQWIPFSDQAIITIYKLAEQPNSIVEQVLLDICDKAFADEVVQSGVDPLLLLSRLIALAGQVALQQMVFLEADVRNELKRRRRDQEDNQEAKQKDEEVRVYMSRSEEYKNF